MTSTIIEALVCATPPIGTLVVCLRALRRDTEKARIMRLGYLIEANTH